MQGYAHIINSTENGQTMATDEKSATMSRKTKLQCPKGGSTKKKGPAAVKKARKKEVERVGRQLLTCATEREGWGTAEAARLVRVDVGTGRLVHRP
jgi:hypothetical protein